MTFKELVIAIVTEGHSDLVMNAAKQAGAQKGTVILGEAFADMNLSDVIQIPTKEKREVILIVCDSAIRDAVIRTINDSVPLDSTGRGMVFSMSVEKYLDTSGKKTSIS